MSQAVEPEWKAFYQVCDRASLEQVDRSPLICLIDPIAVDANHVRVPTHQFGCGLCPDGGGRTGDNK